MDDCYNCGFWDINRGGCSCPSFDKWYACPIESAKPENQEALRDMVEKKKFITSHNFGIQCENERR